MLLKALRVFGFGREGVNVDISPLETSDKELRQAQNATRGSAGAEGAIVMRPGLKKFTGTAADGQILGSIGVPNANSGGGTRNTWGWNRPEDDEWLSWITWPDWGAWGSLGWWDWWDWFNGPQGDVSEDPDLQEGGTVGTGDPRTIWIGRSDANWYQEWHRGDAAFEDANSVKYVASGWGPTQIDVNYLPQIGPDGKTVGTGAPFFAICNGSVYYVGADDPPDSRWPYINRPNLRSFNGQFERLCFTIPNGKPGDTFWEEGPAILSIAGGGGNVFVATVYSGEPTSNKSGKIFYITPPSNIFAPLQLGAVTPDGYWPYAMCWHMGRLWFGTYSSDSAKPGRIYYIRPGIDAAATLDDTEAAPFADVSYMASYDGNLYAAYQSVSNGTFAKIRKRTPAGTWSTSLTGSGGTAKAYNNFHSMVVFDGKLYASFFNKDGATRHSKIYQFDGTTWTVVFTGAAVDMTDMAFHLAVDNGLLFAFGGSLDAVLPINTTKSIMLVTDDGTTWADRSAVLNGTPVVAGTYGPMPVLFGIGPYGIGD